MQPLPGMVRVAEFASRFDADLAVAMLEQAGLEATVLADPAMSVAPHHVTDRVSVVVVREEVVQDAVEVLASGVGRPGEVADMLDAQFHTRRFQDRPAWVRWSTWLLIVAIPVPIALVAAVEVFVLIRGLFP